MKRGKAKESQKGQKSTRQGMKMFYPIEVKCEITTKLFWVRLLVEGVGWWLGMRRNRG
jgi:hypothetical protein